ncbi:UvrD-helicase domain-containing protein [Dictyobacter arantiisoli]|uniref:DNA 3'-5' helicase n=1 Tax=Dictyobacter arantiisoli TaxID=2014874 RepID=A0A5A5TBG1_9CHLR|nr:UvrD-helicase domain-containing protein [Dictyobacter arantiisoli]GCF08339.1 DNA helicase [Dictyobacter arantiisoli]
MDTAIRLTARAVAHRVLTEYQKAHPLWTDDATPVDDLAVWLGLSVATFDARDYASGTFGFMDADEDEDLIWIRRALPETFRRFTLAHEIGHALLHCQDGRRLMSFLDMDDADYQHNLFPALSRLAPCHDTDIQEDMASLLEQEQIQDKLGGHGYDPRSERELAANIFAAELLIPTARLHTLYFAPAALPEQVPAHTLATRFHVSQTALLNRLMTLLDTQPAAATTPVASNRVQPESPRPPAPAKKRYDQFQQAAIEAPTPALVVAGPGSGKTSTLIGRVEYLINAQQVAPQRILALTFSRKATREMTERLEPLLANASPHERPTISTFHAFCADLLRQYGTLVGLRSDFTLVDEAEGYGMLHRQANAMKLQHYRLLQAPTFYFPDMLKAISRAKDELVSPEQYAALARQMKAQALDEEAMKNAEKAEEVAQIYALYQQELQRRGDADYGSLLTLTIQLLSEHPDVLRVQHERFEHILVDEFQDVNRASGVLLRVLAGEARRVWVVGDANQAIYGFRGASPANINQFEHDFPHAYVLPLSRNYRSRPDLVRLAETFRAEHLEPGQQAIKNHPIRPDEKDAYVTISSAPDEPGEIAGIIADIRQKYTRGYAYKDMVILCRTRNQAKKFTQALAAENLPVIEQGGMLEQEYIKDVLSILLLLTNSSGMGLLRAARLPEHRLSQSDIEILLLAARGPQKNVRSLLMTGEIPLNISIEGHHALSRLSEILQALIRSTSVWSLLAQYLLIETHIIRDLLTRPDDKSSVAELENYQQLLQLARHYDQQVTLLQQREQAQASPEPEAKQDSLPDTPYTPSLEEQAKGFLEYLSLLALLRQDSSNRQENSEDVSADTISVMTVHGSKGLEFPVVYLPGLMQRRFPAQARPNATPALTEMLYPSTSNGNDIGEACLFYVGITRARDHLILSYSERYGRQRYQNSRYLEILEQGLPAERMIQRQWSQSGAPSSMDEELELLPGDRQLGTDFITAMRSPTLSASAIDSYLNCPRKYAYQSIYHFEYEPNGYRLFTQAVRKTVETLHRQLDGPRDLTQLPTQQEMQELYTQHWQEAGGHTEPFAPMYEEHAHEILEAMRRQLDRQEETRTTQRAAYMIDVSGKQVHVPIDRIEAVSEQPEQPAKFIRTSYGKSKEKFEPKARELLYTLVSRQHFPEQNIELVNQNLSTNQQMPIKISSRKEQSLYQKVAQAVQGIDQNAYPAQPEDAQRCPGCPFFFICPA